MHTPDQLSLVMKLVEGFHLSLQGDRLTGVRLPLSAIVAVVRSALETGPFFPTSARPEALGDGAVIERRRNHHFRVHERYEVGQLRYSHVSSRSYFFLRSAVIRYLKHYGPLLRVDRVCIQRWS
jgi:hypothetical protein